jgi:predicted dehydrogenase
MNVKEIEKVIETEKLFPKLKLKYGFNHRYHESVKKALEIINSGELGELVNIRGLYGKSMIVPFSGGWRSQRKLSGGGILLDQGIHMIDLMQLFCDEFIEIKSFVSNSFWNHDVEDNAYSIMKDKRGRIAMLNSTATQWQHKFSLEISMSLGFIELHGILSGSKSYGEEKIVIGKRDINSLVGQLEKKTIKFLNDNSWKEEIDEFEDAIINNKKITFGSSQDALRCMKTVFKIYFNDENWRKKFKIKNPK